jgi:hypothetical protein
MATALRSVWASMQTVSDRLSTPSAVARERK